MRKRNFGFTLIELLVVVAIVSILAAVAIPSYNSFVVRTRRTEATSTLLQLANRQEKHFLNFNQYATAIGSPVNATTIDFFTSSDNGHYAISIAVNGSNVDLRATASGAQLTDADCRTFIYQLPRGVLLSLHQNGTVNAAGTCW